MCTNLFLTKLRMKLITEFYNAINFIAKRNLLSTRDVFYTFVFSKNNVFIVNVMYKHYYYYSYKTTFLES